MKKNSRPHKNKGLAFIGLLVVLVFILSCSEQAFAHRINIFAYVEGGKVFTESYFPDGRKCANANIKVFDDSGNLLLQGATCEAGEFVFAIPEKAKSDLRVVLDAGLGHKTEYNISASEFLEQPAGEGRDNKMIQPPGEVDESHDAVDLSTVERVVEEALDKKLKPINRALAKLEQEVQGPSLTEIIGGLGYIFGVAGIIAYVRSRRKVE